MIVIKRDGTPVDYNLEKISVAIEGAFEDLGHVFESAITLDEIDKTIHKRYDKEITVEQIQDIVEEMLCENGYIDEARAYIKYRYIHELARKKKLEDNIRAKLLAENIENQNANIDEYSFGGRKGEADAVFMKQYALDHLVSKMARENHLNNEIYIHDLDAYAVGMHNCLSIPFDDLLANGFNTRQTDVRPANSVNTAMQLVAVIFQLQSLQQFGGVSATHLDWTMVPYVRKSFNKHYLDGMFYLYDGDICPDFKEYKDESIDAKIYKSIPDVYKYAINMTEREVHQAVEGMYHNLNTLQSRSGNQLPFTSINYGTCTLPEGRMVTKALLEVSIEGLGKLHKTSIFPCGIFQCMKGVNRKPGDPNYDLFQLALKSTAQRLYPNYANVDWSGNAGYDPDDPRTWLSTMGCRTMNGFDINGLGQMKDGRGNLCPVTIIMPTLAMQVKEEFIRWHDNIILTEEQIKDGYVKEFMELLDQKIHEAKDMLIERYEYMCAQDPRSAAFMYENNTMYGYIPEEGIRSALKHGTLTIGQLGLAETLQILLGCDHTNPKGMEVAKQIEQLFKDRCAQFKKEYSLNFAVYYTPAENLCYTAMKKFRKQYGVIKNVSDKDFFTNSMHVPVWTHIDPFKKIDIESQLTGYSSGGCITYVELDSTVKHNIEALETLVNYAMDKDIPYFALNVPNDTCLKCGYTDEFNDKCPMCGSTHIQQLRRVTGYLTGDFTTAFNLGKQQETRMRIRHDGSENEI